MSNANPNHGDFDAEMASYLQTFLDETEEQLDDLVETLLSLEGAADNKEDLNEAFRLIHSIKGSAGMMGLDNITVLTHHLENRFERFRSGTEVLDEPTMNLVLRCIDFLRQCTYRLRDQEKLGSPSELLEELKRLEAMSVSAGDVGEGGDDLEHAMANPSHALEEAGPEKSESRPPTLEMSDPEEPDELETEASADSDDDFGGGLTKIIVRFRPNLPLVDLKAQLILSRIAGLGELKSTRPEATLLPDLEQLDEFELQLETEVDQNRLRAAVDVDGVESIEVHGGSGTVSKEMSDEETQPEWSDAERETESSRVVTEAVEIENGAPEEIAERDLDEAEPAISGIASDRATNQQPDPVLQAGSSQEERYADAAPECESAPTAGGDPGGSDQAGSRDEPSGLDEIAESSESPRVEPTVDVPTGNSTDRATAKIAETMRVDIDRLDNLMNLAGELVINRARFVQISGQISPELRNARMHNRVREFSDGLRVALQALEKDSATSLERAKLVQQLRSGLELMDQHSEALEQDRQCIDQIGEAIDQLSLVSHSLQKGVLDTRMIPVGPLFNRFKRVVRDISKERGKRVELQIRGEKTELDKRMIDELGDPLVHLVRNSIDHGLESPEARASLGKPETGTIVLEATHSGNNVYIHVRDDGGGIDVDKIKSKLIANRLLSKAAASELTDSQALDYIWHPGFSTASQVTDISGRGVGMDVVQNRIRQLNGNIEIKSESQRGAHFTIRLPLTLAIINCLLVRLNGIVFSMPIDSVREIVSVDSADIVRVQGKEAFDVRDEYMPLVGINDVFDWSQGFVDRLEDELEFKPTEQVDAKSDSRQSLGESGEGRTAADPHEQSVEVVVLQSAGKAMGLKVDELLGSQDMVIKSLSDNFIEIRGLSGASIMGDGSVCLMLDVATAFRLANGVAVTEANEAENARGG